MLECTNTVTLIHHDKLSDDDDYICTVYENASWHKRTTITTSGDGVKPANSYECRIMTEAEINAELGDWLALGRVESVELPRDVEADKFRITAIGDNRRGSLKHWRFSGQ